MLDFLKSNQLANKNFRCGKKMELSLSMQLGIKKTSRVREKLLFRSILPFSVSVLINLCRTLDR